MSALHSNLSVALASANHLEEAQKEALEALKIDPRNPRAHFVLGGILIQTHGPMDQAIAHLVAAQDTLPSARSAVQRICAAKPVKGCPPPGEDDQPASVPR
jgi:Flp pilus assembly protein TadD